MDGNANKITVICGHYGCGKTNLALNLALESAREKKTAIVDMDIVNPYFRTSEYGALLADAGIRLISPVTANTTLDTPVLPPELNSIFIPSGTNILIDAGGDDAGITALATVSDKLASTGYEMLYVINRYRILSQTPEEAAELLREIEGASRLKACGIVNNSHLGVETTFDTVEASLPFAEETAKLLNLPLLCNTIPDFAVGARTPKSDMKIVKRLVKFPWEDCS